TATSIQPITVIVPVQDEMQTAVNANAYSICRQLSFATTLLFALLYDKFGWNFMCILTIALFALACYVTWLVEKEGADKLLLVGNNPTSFRESFNILPKFVWVILLAFSASGFTEGINNSMSVLVLKDIWEAESVEAFFRSMLSPLIAVVIYPFIACFLTYRKQFLLAMFLLGTFISLYPLMPNALLGFLMLIFWNIGKTCMHSSVYSVIREATDDGSIIARLVALEQWTCTLFYGFAGAIGGPLFSTGYWVPFVFAGIIQIILLVASFLAFVYHDSSSPESFWFSARNALNKPIPKSESQSYLVLE
ncbi:uncharacterized protein LOC142357379, partial [Convolutriloba macropyga]|uniref:uncharacterized protein LOC142357379 n=1 Tax=Convolutriloba macropyga TaxID=536237 RepID=UPI003F526D94